MKEIENKTVLIHQYVISEVVTVLSYKFGPKLAKNFFS